MTALKAFLLVVSLLNSLVRYLHDKKVFTAGQTKEAADALRKASEEISIAAGIQVSAQKAHASDPSDNAFDKDFMRK